MPETIHRPRRAPRNKRPTLADVALAANCSAPVVSAVLNQSRSSSRCSEELAQRIREAADRLGYRPDFASQSLARQSTRTIGVYVPPRPGNSLAYPYEARIILGVERVCQERGHDLLAINLAGGKSPDTCVERFSERRIDGLVLLHSPDSEDWIEALIREYPLIVSVNCYAYDGRMLSVNFDDRAAVTMAVDHLVELGHKRIAYAGNFRTVTGKGAERRREGYLEALQRHGLEVRPEWTVDRNTPGQSWPERWMSDVEAGEFAVDWLLGLTGPRPTAIVTHNDLVAVSVLRALRGRGLRVPDDFSLTGIDDKEMCQFVDPPITTIHQPLEDMGARAASRLLDALGKSDPVTFLTAEPEPFAIPRFVRRESTAPPKTSTP